MQVTFWGVRGSIPAPGPSTVRYGGNTACISIRTSTGDLIILDCGTGARNLGMSLLPQGFGKGQGRAVILLSHAHWDHIQGFPFFVPLYIPGNTFTVYGGARSSALLEGILEGQMAPQYFPVQTLKNMGAGIEICAVPEDRSIDVFGCRVTACTNRHGRTSVLAFRIEEAGSSVVYATDVGYEGVVPPDALEMYRGAGLLIHDSTYTPEQGPRYRERGLSSIEDAVNRAVEAGVRRLAPFHYDQDYTDGDVDALLARGRRMLDERGGKTIELVATAEGLTVEV